MENIMNLEELPECCRKCEHTEELMLSLVLHELRLLNSKIDELNKHLKNQVENLPSSGK